MILQKLFVCKRFKCTQYESESLIKKHEDVGIEYCNDPNAFTECSNTMDDVYENIDDYNPSRKRK